VIGLHVSVPIAYCAAPPARDQESVRHAGNPHPVTDQSVRGWEKRAGHDWPRGRHAARLVFLAELLHHMIGVGHQRATPATRSSDPGGTSLCRNQGVEVLRVSTPWQGPIHGCRSVTQPAEGIVLCLLRLVAVETGRARVIADHPVRRITAAEALESPATRCGEFPASLCMTPTTFRAPSVTALSSCTASSRSKMITAPSGKVSLR
jgi:hypothetical protein